ncbi:RloB-like protein [Salinisphaera shabanensis E1L3A]|uniref:RloB-like protein n=1 Tax=Salinisphaera shabanensis E1L3A TaxID=1033802 RepID=A0ACB4V5V3_9GAMM|nr:RloB family protein [Salinisphaera shabanensis]ERJ19044.1 RloB-like protein [Salinisphaera shabanensis E1L3A]
MAARKLPKTKTLRRKRESKEPKQKIIIVCEGKTTEPDYFDQLYRYVRNPLVKVEVCEAAGEPATIVAKAKSLKAEQLRKAKRSGNSFEGFFSVWAVFDRDEHPKYHEALDLARASDIELAISNPCFEIWLLFHICDYQAPIHRHDLQKKLEEACPGYSAKKKRIQYCAISDAYESAEKRATSSIVNRELEGDPLGNPSTTVHHLTNAIISGG